MPARSRSRSYSRGRASKRYRSASAPRSRSMSLTPFVARRVRRRLAVRGAHSFSRYCTSSDPISCNGVYKAGSITTSISELVQSSDFTGLFDQYRIARVIVTFQLITNPDAAYPLNATTSSATVNPSNWFPKLWYIPDYDGGADETISSIKERQGVRCRIMRPNSVIRVAFTPKCRVLTYSTATSTGYSPRNIKIDMSDVNVEHYGLKYVVDTNQQDPDNTNPFKFIIEKKLIFTCYGVR